MEDLLRPEGQQQGGVRRPGPERRGRGPGLWEPPGRPMPMRHASIPKEVEARKVEKEREERVGQEGGREKTSAEGKELMVCMLEGMAVTVGIEDSCCHNHQRCSLGRAIETSTDSGRPGASRRERTGAMARWATWEQLAQRRWSWTAATRGLKHSTAASTPGCRSLHALVGAASGGSRR